MQPSFVLQEKFKDNTAKTQESSVADFRVGNIVYDVKEWLLKYSGLIKTFKLKYPDLQLKVVKKSPKSTAKEWLSCNIEDDKRKQQEKEVIAEQIKRGLRVKIEIIEVG